MTISKEHISALMDNQEIASSTKAIVDDQELSETWSRYHLIRDALKDDLPEYIDLDLSSRIATALEAEPVILAPKQTQKVVEKKSSSVVKVLHLFGQYGIAASVALAVLVGVQQYQHSSSATDVIKQNPVLNTVPIGGSATPVSINYNADRLTPVQSSGLTEQQLQEQRQRIARYIQDHQLQQRLSPSNR